MAKDLDLHEHHENHSDGQTCGSDPVDCLTKTRVWQTLFLCETMVGGPQGRSCPFYYRDVSLLISSGRTDYGVEPNSVDTSECPPCSDLDDYEKAISRQFAYWVRNVRNIRLISDTHIKLKKKKDWALDQEFSSYNASFKNWPNGLPNDFQLHMSPTGEVPNITSHFVGNMHSHYQLGIIMLHRPQLKASESFGADSQWRHHMSVCYNSAKVLCRLQEGILVNFDLTGLLVMQRGINFTIYAILTCVMLHLVALSSPDPEFNFEAKDYFVRHMRILERCVLAWPMPETEAQINALRAAFSADVHRPFELKESFPHGTPSEHSRPSPVSPPSSEKHHLPQLQQQMSNDLHPSQQPQANLYAPQHANQMQLQAGYLATPPVSVYTADSKPQTPMYAQNYDLSDHASYSSMPSSAGGYYQQTPSTAEIQWNPTPIMDQFDTAFAIPASALAPPPSLYGGSGASPPGSMHNMHQPASFASTSSPTYGTTTSPNYAQQQQIHQQQQQHYFAAQQTQSFHETSPPITTNPHLPQAQAAGYATTGAGGAAMFVTPQQWQQSVANVIDAGRLKRRWEYTQ